MGSANLKGEFPLNKSLRDPRTVIWGLAVVRNISSSSMSNNANASPLLRRSMFLCTWLFLALFSSQRSFGLEASRPLSITTGNLLDPQKFLLFRQIVRDRARARSICPACPPLAVPRAPNVVSLSAFHLQTEGPSDAARLTRLWAIWSKLGNANFAVGNVASFGNEDAKCEYMRWKLRALTPGSPSLPKAACLQKAVESDGFSQMTPVDHRLNRWIVKMQWIRTRALLGGAARSISPTLPHRYQALKNEKELDALSELDATARPFIATQVRVAQPLQTVVLDRSVQSGQSINDETLGPKFLQGTPSPVFAQLPVSSPATDISTPQIQSIISGAPQSENRSPKSKIEQQPPLGVQEPFFVPVPQSSRPTQAMEVRENWGTYRLLNPTLEINPGQAFILRNWYQTTRDDVQVQRRLQLPKGWRVGSDFRTTLALTNNEATLDIVNIAPPFNAPAGRYTCTLVHESEGDPSPPILIPIEVKPYYKVHVNADSLPPALSSNQPVNLEIRLENLGNTPVEIHPDCSSNLNAKITFTPSKLTLLPGERGVTQFAARDLHLLGYQSDWVVNLAFRGADDTLLGQAAVNCPVFASGLDRGRSYENSIDTEFQWLYASDGKLQDLVWQWSGSGYINRARSRKIDFFLQLPGESSNGTQDPTKKGRLSFVDLDWRLDLGDSTYVLSPLTQPGILARGLRIYRSWSHLQLALFGLRERDYTNDISKRGLQYGGSALMLTESGDYQVEVLDKRRQDITDTTLNSPHQRIYSAQYRSIASAWGRLVATMARNDHTSLFPQESGRWAYQLNWHTPFKSSWQGSVLWTQQQLGYWGSSQNRNEGSVFFSRQFKPLYVSVQGYYGRDNPGAKSANSALQSQNVALSLRKNLPLNLKGSLDINYRRKFDTVQLSENDSSHGVAPGLTYTGEVIMIDGGCDIYRARDYLKKYSKWPQLNPQLGVEYQILPTLRLYWRGNWGPSPLQVPFEGSTGHTLGLFLNLSPYADVSFASNFANASNQRTQNYSTAINWRPWTDHTIKFNYNANLYPRSGAPNTHTLMVNYSIFFGLPSGRSTGSDLRGSVADAQDPKSSHRYIVCLGGRKSLTTSSGQFVFSNVPAGDYPIWLENLPHGKVEDDTGIQSVRLVSGKLEKRSLSVTSAARIRGHVRITRDDNKVVSDDRGQLMLQEQSTGTVEGISGAVITWRAEGSSRRIVVLTDSQGYFEFNQLRPGKGILEAVDLPVPENYKLATASSQLIELNPGSEYGLEWRIVPQVRRIKMIN